MNSNQESLEGLVLDGILDSLDLCDRAFASGELDNNSWETVRDYVNMMSNAVSCRSSAPSLFQELRTGCYNFLDFYKREMKIERVTINSKIKKATSVLSVIALLHGGCMGLRAVETKIETFFYFAGVNFLASACLYGASKVFEYFDRPNYNKLIQDLDTVQNRMDKIRDNPDIFKEVLSKYSEQIKVKIPHIR
ncbi:hypothetical protein J4216_04595 [Candidatus Woesearchaeota archaeon]|nr:hypothetical protein [Candidatus Woesearchaeota archaeon]